MAEERNDGSVPPKACKATMKILRENESSRKVSRRDDFERISLCELEFGKREKVPPHFHSLSLNSRTMRLLIDRTLK